MERVWLDLDDTRKAFRICVREGACRNERYCYGCPLLEKLWKTGDVRKYECQRQLYDNVEFYLEEVNGE